MRGSVGTCIQVHTYHMYSINLLKKFLKIVFNRNSQEFLGILGLPRIFYLHACSQKNLRFEVVKASGEINELLACGGI